jgi:hypothetical protein
MVTAPAFASSSVGIASGASNSTVSVTCPTGTSPGALLLFFAANDAANSYSSWSASLTPVYCSNGTDFPTPTDGHQGDIGSGSWYRFADGTDVAGSTTYSVTKLGAATAQPNLLFCLRYTGVDPAQFPGTAPTINTTNKTAIGTKRAYKMGPNTTTAANAACPAPVNPTSIVATDTVVRAYVFGSDATNSSITLGTTPAGFTKRGGTTAQTAVAAKFNVGMLVADITGTTSPGVATTTCNVVGMWDIFTFALPATPDVTAGFMPFFGMGHHDDELTQRPSGLYVQRRRIAGVRPDGGRDRVLVHS